MYALLIVIFLLGYAAIIFEHNLKLDKAAPALLTGVLCWVVLVFGQDISEVAGIDEALYHHFAEISGILFFLIGAMTIVELIDLYDGFQLIIDKIKTTSKKKLFFIVTLLSFILSAIIDNLTTSIIMASLLGKILEDKDDRWLFAGMVVIAANAGGAWSPIGDVTTTMLWIGNQVTTMNLILEILLPSIVCTLIPFFILRRSVNGSFNKIPSIEQTPLQKRYSTIIFYSGVGLLLFVPIFKTVTHLPPFMGMMFSVGILWAISSTLERRAKKENEKIENNIFDALEKIDLPSILFFAGILLAVSALQEATLLRQLANFLSSTLKNENLIVTVIGVFSAIFDNVPLVAAMQGMYDYPTDSPFWLYLAYCAGTGGSLLIIGSAAGVAIMGIEKINFFWYLKKIGWVALVGFLAGCGTYLLIEFVKTII
jgi:Na+/H+ antiporter NhaD/arsenite permease-like protein